MSQTDFKLYPKQQRTLLSKANEILYGGSAGSGKSYLMRVISIILATEIPNLKIFLFRRLYKELYFNHVYASDGYLVMLKPFLDDKDVVFNKSEGIFNFYNGSQIYLCHAQHEVDIQSYLGAEIHVLLVDEATQFTESMIRFIRTRVRLGTLEIPDRWKPYLPKIIYGTNPGGISHAYFKRAFVVHGPGKLFRAPSTDGGMLREFIPALYGENIIMAKNDPQYADRIRGIGDPSKVEAYLNGSWDGEEGTAFGDLWDPDKHIIDSIYVPPDWKIDRSHDYGYSAPAATLYFAEASGSTVVINNEELNVPRRSLILLYEIYFADNEDRGLMLNPIELALKMRQFEIDSRIRLRVQAGPADSSIFDKEIGFASIHDYYSANGVTFYKADKRPGSRRRGFISTRQMLYAAAKRDPEQPWLLVCRNCVHTISQLPSLSRSKVDPDDVDTDSNDHIYDVVKYRVLKSASQGQTTKLLGT